MKKTDLEKQVHLFKKIVKDPNNKAYRTEYAEFLMNLGFEDEALEHYNFNDKKALAEFWIKDLEEKLKLAPGTLLNHPIDVEHTNIYVGRNEDIQYTFYEYHDEFFKKLAEYHGVNPDSYKNRSLYFACSC